MNEPRLRRDLCKMLWQHFPDGTKPTEGNEFLISGQTDSTNRNGPVPSKTAANIHGTGPCSVPGYGIFGRRSGAQVSFPPGTSVPPPVVSLLRRSVGAYEVEGS